MGPHSPRWPLDPPLPRPAGFRTEGTVRTHFSAAPGDLLRGHGGDRPAVRGQDRVPRPRRGLRLHHVPGAPRALPPGRLGPRRRPPELPGRRRNILRRLVQEGGVPTGHGRGEGCRRPGPCPPRRGAGRALGHCPREAGRRRARRRGGAGPARLRGPHRGEPRRRGHVPAAGRPRLRVLRREGRRHREGVRRRQELQLHVRRRRGDRRLGQGHGGDEPGPGGVPHGPPLPRLRGAGGAGPEADPALREPLVRRDAARHRVGWAARAGGAARLPARLGSRHGGRPGRWRLHPEREGGAGVREPLD
mmetsp:Transcript_71181/g.200882  ORF Transcript_71181/g.200882 Transcript_71181/m.200882 type:complete len:304 (+) Transcript_71181:168-1079(+)